MASTAHGGLTADTVKSVEVEAGRKGVVVVNRAQTGVIWVRLDGTDPVVEGGGTYAVFGAREFDLPRVQQGATVTVKMVADSALAYSVEGY